MRKLFSILIIIFISFIYCFKPARAFQFGGAEYQVIENIVNNELGFGIKHRTDIGKSDIINNELDFQQVNAIEIPASQDIKIVTWSKLAPTRWNLTPVRAMANDYELKNPGYKVVAAINGDFFDINGVKDLPFATGGIHISNGENYKTIDNEKGSAREPIGFKNDGSINSLIGNVKYTRSNKMILAIYNHLDEIIYQFPIDKVNNEVLNNEIGIYYGKWDNDVIIPVEVNNAFIVKNSEFALAYSDEDFYGKGLVNNVGSATLLNGDFAIVSKNPEVSNKLKVGVKIRAQYELTGDFTGIKEATGAGKPIIYQSEFMPDITDFGKARHPRTMVGIKNDGTIVMIVVDGRQEKMAGASQPEMAAIVSYYGCVDAYNLDGGGSSTMMIAQNGEFIVTNSPSDNRERSDANCLLVVAKVPVVELDYIVKTNNIDVKANLLDLNGYNFNDLFIGINNDIRKVENGKVTFNNLQSNTDYLFVLYYQEENEYIPLFIKNRIKTAKAIPILNYLHMEKQNNDIILIFNFNDPDYAIQRNSIEIDGISYTIVNNQVKLTNFKGNLINLLLKYNYDLNDGTGRHDIEIENLKIRCGLKIYMNLVNDNFIAAVFEIFK